jgi:hypothetical protein
MRGLGTALLPRDHLAHPIFSNTMSRVSSPVGQVAPRATLQTRAFLNSEFKSCQDIFLMSEVRFGLGP